MQQNHLSKDNSFFDKRLEGLNKAASMAVTDPKGTITSANSMFSEISGYSIEELLGKNHRILKSGIHPPDFYRTMWQTISSGQIWRGRICNKKKNGALYWVNSTIVPILDPNGVVSEYFAVRFEITNEVLLEEKAKQDQIKNIFNSQRASLSRIAGGIAHEIFNPLSIIQALLLRNKQLLDIKPINRELVDTNFKKIENSVARIVKIIQGMKTVADQGSNEPIANHKFSDIIESALDLCRESLREKKIELRVSVSDVQIKCRKAQIQQVIINLISNSTEAITKLNSPRWIEINTPEISDTGVLLTITDSGKGIPDSIADKIMDPFFTTTPAGNGIGLGLTLSQNILVVNKGMIYLDKSCPNTRFIIELPR